MASQSSRRLIAAVASLTTVAVLIVAPAAQAPDRARTEAMARRAAERLQALQREADRLAADERTIINDVRKLEIERQLKAEELKRVDADAKKVQADLDATSQRITSLEESEKKQTPELRARLVEIYKLGQGRYLRMLLSTADLRQLAQSTRTVAALAKIDRDRIASHAGTLDDLKKARRALEARRAEIAVLRGATEKAHVAAQRAEQAKNDLIREIDRDRIASHARTLDDLKKERKALEARRAEIAVLRGAAEKAQVAAQHAEQVKNDLIRDIDRKRDLNAQLAGELQAAQQRLQAALRDLGSSIASPGADAAALPLKPFRGALEWPAAGAVARRVGRATAANGIEITADDGASARAVHDGVVAFAGAFAGFGNLVILDHGSQSFSLYGDLLEVGVKKGDHVAQGQPLGTVGPTSSGGNGLYFELRVDGQPVDPLQWLKKR
jgi:septal ring factor EnvC (AmiA/AmiB activator)